MSVSATSSVRPQNPIESLIPQLPSENAETARAAAADGSKRSHVGMFGAEDDSPSFWDLLDVINPLQHIPLVNDLYRDLSDDKIGVAARLSGGALFGGVIGLVSAAINSVMEESTGATVGGHALALLRGDDAAGDSGTALAQAPPADPARADPARADIARADIAADKTETGGQDKMAANAARTDETGRGGARTDARPVLLADLIGTEPAPPPAVPRPEIIASAATPPAGTAAAPAAPSPSPAAVSIAATAETAAAHPWPGRQGPLRPLPARTTQPATRTPPAVTTAVSGNSGRSALPVTGARPQAGLIAPANAAPVVAAQAEGAAPSSAPAAGNDWFTAAMAEGLNKYQRSNARASAAVGEGGAP